jgi:uncharacterized membrane protein required for colicin V production
MTAGMNWLDYALLIIVGFSVLHGLSNGALRMLTSILSFALGIYGASMWYREAGALAQAHFGTSPGASDIISYVAIFLLVFVAIELAGQRIIALAEVVHLNLLNRLAGAALGAVLGVLFAGLNIALLTILLPPNYPLLKGSELAPEILSYDQRLLGYVPSQLQQEYEDKREELARYWNTRRMDPAAAPEPTR